MTRPAAALALALLTLSATAAGQTATLPSAAGQVETLAEIRIHGNHTTPDDEVLQAMGLTIGQPLDDAAVQAAAGRLRKTGRFVQVEIRKRYRSLEPGGDVSLIVVVQEQPVPDQALAGPAILKPFERLWNSGMFMPVLRYDDGYGFTYGARISAVDWPRRGSRLSAPLTWGGTKRAALEYERTMSVGPFDRIFVAGSVSRRTNPFYELDEDRQEVTVEASKQVVRHLRAGGHAGYADVGFGTLKDWTVTYGADVSFDTRMDPVFPRNAVFASAGWERLDPTRTAPVNRFKAEVRAYRGLIGQSVLAVRVQYAGADATQPDYARNLLGGAANLRGYGAGSFAGDNLVAGSAELRIPITSPKGILRAGITVFADTGTVWDHGQALSGCCFQTGAGVGGFLVASLLQVSLDVGFRQGGEAAVHFTAGLHF
jgi:outer membrane protein assembly factor BamA